MDNIKDIKNKIDKYLIFAKKDLLKGKLLNKLVLELRGLKVNKEINEILKLEIEKLQKKPNTVWTDMSGYTKSGEPILLKWKPLIDNLDEEIKRAKKVKKSKQVSKSKYFTTGSMEQIFNQVESLVQGAENSIKIYDNYINAKILTLLIKIDKDKKIQIITSNSSITPDFLREKEAFKVLSKRDFELRIYSEKDKPSHDRYYIIDNENVFSLGVSTRGSGANEAANFWALPKEEGIKMIKDYNKWFDEGKEISTKLQEGA